MVGRVLINGCKRPHSQVIVIRYPDKARMHTRHGEPRFLGFLTGQNRTKAVYRDEVNPSFHLFWDSLESKRLRAQKLERPGKSTGFYKKVGTPSS